MLEALRAFFEGHMRWSANSFSVPETSRSHSTFSWSAEGVRPSKKR